MSVHYFIRLFFPIPSFSPFLLGLQWYVYWNAWYCSTDLWDLVHFSSIFLHCFLQILYFLIICLQVYFLLPFQFCCFTLQCMLNFIRCFSVSVEMTVWFFSFNLLPWWIILFDLLKKHCIPRINSNWLYYLFYTLLSLVSI